VLKSKLQWYLAEIESERAANPTPVVQSVAETAAAVEHEVAKSFVGASEALQRAQDRLLVLEEQIVHERHLQEQHRDMAAAIATKIDDAQEAVDAGGSQASGSSASNSQAKELGRKNKEIIVAMNQFLSQHYPRPTPEEGADADGKRTKQTGNISRYLEQPKELLTMQDILEEMMNIAMTKPHAPYIALDDRYWPPYIELLVRWGIGMKHPQHSNQVKLCAYHI
jgi:centromere protein K